MNRISATILLSLLALSNTLTGSGTDNASAGSAKAPIRSLLKPDGSLDLKNGFTGSLDLAGYRMVTGPDGEPRFLPAPGTTVSGPIPPSSPGPESDPSDVYWDDQFGIPGASNRVFVAAVDDSGRLYIGGRFLAVGTVMANHIAMWNGSAWSPLGAGVDADVYALATNGSAVYVGGPFRHAGEVSAAGIAKWDGASWSALGSGVEGFPLCIEVIDQNVYAGGSFSYAGGIAASNIAKWDGSAWSALGSGTAGSSAIVHAVVGSDSFVYAAGEFTTAGGQPADHVARWDGSAWSPLGSGLNASVAALAVSGSDLYAGGSFSVAGGVNASRLARWDGSEWSALGNGPGLDYVRSVAVGGTDVYAAGYSGPLGFQGIAITKWDGSSWSPLGSGVSGVNPYVYDVVLSGGGDVYAVGSFTYAGEDAANFVAKWNGTAWSALGSGIGGGYFAGLSRGVRAVYLSWFPVVHSVAARGTNVVVGGEIAIAGQPGTKGVASWNGSAWSSLGSGLGGRYPYAFAVATTDASTYVGGFFASAGGVPANLIAQWDGTTWSGLGNGLERGSVHAIAANGLGLYAGGSSMNAGVTSLYGIAKWDGSHWSSLAGGVKAWGVSGEVTALAVQNANLYVGGGFTSAGNINAYNVAMWDGTSWSPLGLGLGETSYSPVQALAVSGDYLYAGGSFATAGGASANHVAKWNGSEWSSLGSGTNKDVYGLAACEKGLFAGGSFTSAGEANASRIAKWDGEFWSALGTGFDRTVHGLAVERNTLFAGGSFSIAGNKPSGCFAVWQPRVNVTETTMSASPGAMTIGDDVYGYYKPALMTGSGTTVSYAGGLPTTITLDRAPEIHVGGARVNGAFTLLPEGITFGSDGAVLRVEFSEDDVTSYPGTTFANFRAVKMTYPVDHPDKMEAVSITGLSDNTPFPIRIENGRQIYAITLPVTEIGSTHGAVPRLYAASADLALIKSSIPDVVYQGQVIAYRLTAENREALGTPLSTANSVLVTDELPPGVMFKEASTSQGTVSCENRMVTAQLGSLDAGTSASVDIVGTAVLPGTVNNVAFVSADEADLAASNNIAAASTIILPSVDLGITKSAQPDPVSEEQELRYQVEVTNLGDAFGQPTSATDVVVTDTLPEGLVYKSASASQGVVRFTSPTLAAEIGVLPAGSKAALEIVVTAVRPGQTGNTARVSCAEHDRNLGNNEAHTSSTIVRAAGPDLTGSWSSLRQSCRVTRRGMACMVQGLVEVLNAGDAAAGRSEVTFYVASEPRLSPEAMVLKTYRVASLRPGQPSRVSLRASLPADDSATGRYVIAVLDSADSVSEARERNNAIMFGPVD